MYTLKLLLDAEMEEEEKRCYTSQLLWMNVNAIYAFGGSSLEIPTYSDLFMDKKKKEPQKSAKMIVDDIIGKLEGGATDGRSV